jgi:uncharacterized protein
MNLEPYRIDAPIITAHGPGWIAVDGHRFESSIVIRSDGAATAWPVRRFADLDEPLFAALAQQPAHVALFGSGTRLRFPAAAWLRPLVAAGIGLESMDTPAACRTYNILAGEGRIVVAALLIESTSI